MAQRIRKRRRAFDTGQENTSSRTAQQSVYQSEDASGIFGFFKDFGVRETIESIIIAVVLALMFRTFEAEAFIIPTGSMAPTLQGHHIDVNCDQCDYRYRTGASYENSTYAPRDRVRVTSSYCPICNHELKLQRGGIGSTKKVEHESNYGDRILVNKFIYDFIEPRRWDVIVFKYPNNGKQNYIKRLVGLPNEKLSIDNGDIYSYDDNLKKSIIRKPPEKIRVMMQLVDDTKHIPAALTDAGWPLRWQPWEKLQESWEDQVDNGTLRYFLKPSEQTEWLSYRHLRPRKSDWEDVEKGEVNVTGGRQFGQLITDYYAYNDADLDSAPHRQNPNRWGSHWVGDLILESNLKVNSEAGTVSLKLVEGGAAFICNIDVSTGKATLSCDSPKVKFVDGDKETERPTAQTKLKGSGNYSILYANVDDQIHLWVNNRLAKFDVSTYERDGVPVPRWSPANAGDAEPLAIGGKGVELTVERLKVHRDIYYTSVGGTNQLSKRTRAFSESGYSQGELLPIFQDPRTWSSPRAIEVLTKNKGLKDPMFQLDADQLLPMGDNSPHSQDSRIWPGPRFLPEEYLLGRAMFIYWPHMKDYPIPNYTPNFGDMGFIR